MANDSASAPSAEFDMHPLWRFSVALYGVSGIQAACLALQDEYDLDVNLVLACLWHERRGAPALTAPDIRALLAASDIARTRVRGIRRLRRDVAETARGTALHRTLLHAELLAENAVQGSLFRELEHAPSASPGRGLASLQSYAGEAGIRVPLERVQLLLDSDAPT